MRRATRRAPEVVASGPAGARAAATATAAASAATASAGPSAGPGTTRELIWRLQSGGWSQLEAGNLAAIALGLRPARTGWTGTELDHLRFLKSLVFAGRLER